MPNLSIKDVPEPLAQALRERAARNHRSLQGELMAIVEQAVAAEATASLAAPAGPAAGGGPARVVGYDSRGWPIVLQGWMTPEQVIAEARAAYPKPVGGQPLARDILREDRDRR